VVADPGDKIWRGVRVQVGKQTVISGIADRLASEHVERAVAGNNGGDSVGLLLITRKRGQNIGVLLEYVAQHRVKRAPIGFDVNEQRDLWTIEINPSAIFLHAFAKGIEIERLQGSFRLGLGAIMRDEKLSIHEENIRL